MLLNVTDANGVLQTVIAHGQETLNDASGQINTTGTAQYCLQANPGRSGWLFQNISNDDMWVNDIGPAAINGCFKVSAGQFFPPAGYAVNTEAISVLGNTGDRFIARDW